MEEQTAAPAEADFIAPPPADNTELSASEAASLLAKARWDAQKPAEPQAETPAEPPKELAETPTSDPPPEAPAETTEAPEPEAELPPVEPPRSWTKEAKERWQSLPRETQSYLAEREQEREREFRRGQNEAAEVRKAAEAERTKAEQQRQQYEQALPQLYQSMVEAQHGEFPDIKSWADAERVAQTDPARAQLWQIKQGKIAQMEAEVRAAQTRQAQDFEQKWNDFANREDKLLVDKIPELAKKDFSQKTADAARSLLNDIGFSDEDLGSLWNGKASVSLRDHRVQQLIHDAVRYREAKANIAKPSPKPLPPVQKPGVAAPKGAGDRTKLDDINKRLEKATGKEATDLAYEALQLQRRLRAS